MSDQPKTAPFRGFERGPTALADPPIVPSAGTVTTDELTRLFNQVVELLGADAGKRILRSATDVVDVHLGSVGQMPLMDRPTWLAAVAHELLTYREQIQLPPKTQFALSELVASIIARLK